MSRRVVMSLMFFPRGGSAQVARYMARSLPDAGWDVTLVAGAPGGGRRRGDAGTVFEGDGGGATGGSFFGGSEVRSVDSPRAIEAEPPSACAPPLHPSFEDRPEAP